MRSWSQDPQGYIEDRSIPVPFSGCWLWTGALSIKGYGIGSVNGNAQRAHRLAHVAFIGDIPLGLVVCHRCDVRSCVNPAHLFLGTQRQNLADMVAKGRSPRGAAAGGAKLTEASVLAIRQDTRAYSEVAEQYGIHPKSVGNIKRGFTWGHLHGS